MKLKAFFYRGDRDPAGDWDVEVSTDGATRDDRHTDLIATGISRDWIQLATIQDPDFATKLLHQTYAVSVDKHPWDSGNEWYVTPLVQGVVVEHQWAREYQRDQVGWYSWDLVHAVVVLTQWIGYMRQNTVSLDPITSRSAVFTIDVHNWQPAGSLRDLGWKSAVGD
jgi:hypothetical protein